MKMPVAAWFLLAFVVIVLAAHVPETAAQGCNPTALTPCAASITNGSPPSADCCTKLKGQQSCLCGYLKNPALQPYVSSPNAKKVLSACKVPIPRC